MPHFTIRYTVVCTVVSCRILFRSSRRSRSKDARPAPRISSRNASRAAAADGEADSIERISVYLGDRDVGHAAGYSFSRRGSDEDVDGLSETDRNARYGSAVQRKRRHSLHRLRRLVEIAALAASTHFLLPGRCEGSAGLGDAHTDQKQRKDEGRHAQHKDLSFLYFRIILEIYYYKGYIRKGAFLGLPSF